jgi:hypothetical protein
MHLVFLHGWSVTDTATYGRLPQILAERAAAAGIDLQFTHVHLGRYISFRNEVRMDDLVRALDHALRELLGRDLPRFACVTHSTGGVLARSWIEAHYGASGLTRCPLTRLILLAPPNHGSALAILGSGRISRLRSWFQGVEPGDGVLRWLELGSEEARVLNRAWLDYPSADASVALRTFVLTGETIDSKLYDYLNSYTAEVGSDGVVRVASASLDHRWLELRQSETTVPMCGTTGEARLLEPAGNLRTSDGGAFRIVPDAAHSGSAKGILESPTPANAERKPVVSAILEALTLGDSPRAYAALATAWAKANDALQAGRGRKRRFFQLIVRVTDDRGATVPDFDLILLAGPRYDPEAFPRGFVIDKQVNRRTPHTITFYLDFDAVCATRGAKFGFRIVARPSSGFARYEPAEFRLEEESVDRFVTPNCTWYVDVTLLRHVDRQTARFDPASAGPRDFRGQQPEGTPVP